jgi:hypothetical protein
VPCPCMRLPCALSPQLLRTRAVVALPLRGGYGVPSQCTSCFFALSTGSCLPALVQASATLTGKSHAAARQLSRRSLSAAAACHCPMLWPAVQRVAVLCECATHRVWFPSRDRWPASAAVIACTLFAAFTFIALDSEAWARDAALAVRIVFAPRCRRACTAAHARPRTHESCEPIVSARALAR